MEKERILTPGFCFIAAANFLLFLSFYSLMPILPYFLREMCSAADSTVGLVLASYSVVVLIAIAIFALWTRATKSTYPRY